MSPPSVAVPSTSADSSQAGHARRQALALANLYGLRRASQGQLAIVVTEAAANIAAHAERGEIVLVPWRFREDAGIDVLALDNGKGIADVGDLLRTVIRPRARPVRAWERCRGWPLLCRYIPHPGAERHCLRGSSAEAAHRRVNPAPTMPWGHSPSP